MMHKPLLSEMDAHLRQQFDANWFSAAVRGNTELLSSYCRQYAFDIDYQGSNGTTALMEAAFAGQLDTVAWLLSAGAEPNCESAQGGAALAHAAAAGHAAVIDALLDAGAELDHPDHQRGVTALTQACIRGQVEAVRLLLRRGADPFAAGNHGPSALEYTAATGQGSILGVLLDEARVERPAGWADRAFWAAAGAAQVGLAQRFLDAGANINHRNAIGFTALHQAARHGSVAAFPLLLSNGSDINARSASGWTPLLLALKFRQPEAAVQLLEAGADPDLAEPDTGVTPLMHAAILGHTGPVDALLSRGARLEPRDRQHGKTAADWAEAYQNEDAAALIRAQEGRG